MLGEVLADNFFRHILVALFDRHELFYLYELDYQFLLLISCLVIEARLLDAFDLLTLLNANLPCFSFITFLFDPFHAKLYPILNKIYHIC